MNVVSGSFEDNPFHSRNLTCTLANSEDPDEMPHDAAFYQGLHCLLKQKRFSLILRTKACDPSIYTMDHPMFIVSNQKEESISTLRVKQI